MAKKEKTSDGKVKRIVKRTFITVIILLIVVIGGARLVAPGLIRGIAQEKATEALGREVLINDIDLALLRGAVYINDLVIKAPEGFSEKNALSIDRFGVNVALSSLMSDQIVVQKVILRGVSFNAERNKAGDINWKKIAEGLKPAEEESGTAKKILIEDIIINNSEVVFIDGYELNSQARSGVYNMYGYVRDIKVPDPASELETSFELHGDFMDDRNSPFVLHGYGHFQAEKKDFQVSTTLTNVDLTKFGPYLEASPVNINQGGMTAKSMAECRQNELEGNIDFAFYKVDMKGKSGSMKTNWMGVPVNVLVAFFKNAEGDVPLEVNFKGDITDPEFRISAAIQKAFIYSFGRQIGNLAKTGVKLGVDAVKTGVDISGDALKVGGDAVKDAGNLFKSNKDK